mmetsp:Transcript_109548/g.234122  ORF Transcript_109548/g.234122 Transcript_109548/m.234122 type:complete len:237 (-) Transcript_109548:127-837(-)
MAQANMKQASIRGVFKALQQQDPLIDNIVVYSEFVVAYLMEESGPNPGWRKANIEGPMVLVRRRSAPRFQLIVKNQLNSRDLQDNMDQAWELDCQKNYVFYKSEDASKRIRGLWFKDDAERLKVQTSLERSLDELRREPEQQMAVLPRPGQEPPVPSQAADGIAVPPPDGSEAHAHVAPLDQKEIVIVTADSLRASLLSLAEDDSFVAALMQKLKQAQPEVQEHLQGEHRRRDGLP